jgi:hypothetical protein
MNDNCVVAQICNPQMRRNDRCRSIARRIDGQKRQIAEMAELLRAEMPAGGGGIEMAAGGQPGDGLAVLFARTAIGMGMDVEPVFSRRQPVQGWHDSQAARGIGQGQRADRGAQARLVDPLHRDFGGLRRRRARRHTDAEHRYAQDYSTQARLPLTVEVAATG